MNNNELTPMASANSDLPTLTRGAVPNITANIPLPSVHVHVSVGAEQPVPIPAVPAGAEQPVPVHAVPERSEEPMPATITACLSTKEDGTDVPLIITPRSGNPSTRE